MQTLPENRKRLSCIPFSQDVDASLNKVTRATCGTINKFTIVPSSQAL